MKPNAAWLRSSASPYCSFQRHSVSRNSTFVSARDALVEAVELGLREVLDADEERRDAHVDAARHLEGAVEARGVAQEPLGARLEQQREARHALGGAALDHLGEIAERVLILEHEQTKLGRVGPHVADLLEHRRRGLGVGAALVVIAGGAEGAAAAVAFGDLGAGVERILARVELKGAAVVADHREGAHRGQRVGVDDARAEVGRVAQRALRRDRGGVGRDPFGEPPPSGSRRKSVSAGGVSRSPRSHSTSGARIRRGSPSQKMSAGAESSSSCSPRRPMNVLPGSLRRRRATRAGLQTRS